MSMSLPPPPHEAVARDISWSGTEIAAVALATAAELGIVIAGALNIAPIAELAAVHAGVGLLLGLVTMPLSAGNRGNPALLLFVISLFAFGPLGPLGTGLTMALHRGFARRATPFEQWYAALFPKVTTTRTQTVYERVALRGGGPPQRGTVAPFLDVMALGTVRQKQVVIGMIADEFHPKFAAALRGALNDSEPAIRVQAATAFARIESQFLERSLMLEAAHTACPEDTDVIFALARHHEACAESGLLDDGRARTELAGALAYCEHVAEARPDDHIVAEAVARLLLRLGRPEAALPRLRPFITRPGVSPETQAGYFACLFRLGRFAQLREACRHAEAESNFASLPIDFADARRLWANAATTQTEPPRSAPGARVSAGRMVDIGIAA